MNEGGSGSGGGYQPGGGGPQPGGGGGFEPGPGGHLSPPKKVKEDAWMNAYFNFDAAERDYDAHYRDCDEVNQARVARLKDDYNARLKELHDKISELEYIKDNTNPNKGLTINSSNLNNLTFTDEDKSDILKHIKNAHPPRAS